VFYKKKMYSCEQDGTQPTMKADKVDIEGQYVRAIIERQKSPPRSLPSKNLFHLYTTSPNSRYSFFVGFMLILGALFLVFVQLRGGRYSDNTLMIIIIGFLVALAFLLPLANVMRIKHALEQGVSTIGTVTDVEAARDGAYSTAEGMRHGAIKALVSFNVNSDKHDSSVFLDRPWVRSVRKGTQLTLLIDPNNASIFYVVGIVQ
jgi:hypothetical protein